MAWLLWTVFKFMITLHGPNIGEFMTNLFKGLGTVMLLAIILRAPPSFIAGYVVDVPVGIATGLAQEMMKMTGNDGSVTIAVPYEDSNGCRQVRFETTKFCNPTTNAADFDGKMLSVHVYDNMTCLLRKMSFELIRGMAIGATIIEYSFKQATFGVLPNFTMLIGGIIVFIAYFILFIMVPFKLVDILLRMGFVVILLPLFIVCMATNATRGYAKKGWEMFLGCWITLICLCLFMVFAITLIAAAFLK